MRLPSILLSLWLVGLLVVFSQRVSAQVSAPSQGGGVNVIRATATTMELEFGINGTGQGRVVAIAATKSGMPVPLPVTDGQRYQAATTYGEGAQVGRGFVVYSGEKHSATITGLKPNTYYYIMNAEYNADSTSISYNARGTSIATATKDMSPLPVELTSFTGVVSTHNMAILKWTTASERNTAHFILERSVDGISFTKVGQVAATNNSTKLVYYELVDPQQLTCPIYYRLCQVDLDGAVYYSPLVTLTPTSTRIRTLSVYPNPSAGQSIQLLVQGYEGEVLKLYLTDNMGRLIANQTISPNSPQYLTPLPMPQGVSIGAYILTLYSNDHTFRQRVVVSN
jgi:hypothetical protein